MTDTLEPAAYADPAARPLGARPALPIYYDATAGVHIVSGFTECSEILRSEGWSSDPRNNPLLPPESQLLTTSSVLFMDPPDHTRLRRLIAPAFTPRRLQPLRSRIEGIVDQALAQLGDGSDLVSELSHLVPVAVIAELLDVGADGAEMLMAQTPRLVRILEVDATAEDLSEAASASLEVTMFLTPLLAQRRQQPGEDFISFLLSQEELTLTEVLATVITLLTAGHETTAALIASGAYALIQQRGQIPALLNDPSRAIDELLRHQPPVKLLARVAMADHQIGNHLVAQGDVALLLVDTANRDPDRFERPDELDLARDPVPSLVFGAGVHFCLGAGLARMEAEVTLSRLFTQHPDVAVEAESTVRWRPSSTFHTLDLLRITGLSGPSSVS